MITKKHSEITFFIDKNEGKCELLRYQRDCISDFYAKWASARGGVDGEVPTVNFGLIVARAITDPDTLTDTLRGYWSWISIPTTKEGWVDLCENHPHLFVDEDDLNEIETAMKSIKLDPFNVVRAILTGADFGEMPVNLKKMIENA